MEEDLQGKHDIPGFSAPQPGLWLYLSVPLVGIVLCGSEEPWALGIFAMLVGLTAAFATPRNRLTAWLTLPVILGLILCLLAFLPASWFSLPDWRITLQRDFGIALPSTRTPQPGVTLESWLLLAVGAVWLVTCAARGFTASERRSAIRALAFFSCLVACFAIVVYWRKIVIPFWHAPSNTFYFGPFPNRNLFSELLAAGAVLVFAATYDALRRGERIWMLLGLAIFPIFAAVLLNTSRTGVVIFFAGTGAWMLTGDLRKGAAPRIAVGVAVLLVLAATFVLFGGHIAQRFSNQNLAADSRLRIFADTIKITRLDSVLGTGLGNFEPVFALNSPHGDVHNRAHHPENDWLLLGMEAGLPCMLLGIVALVALVRKFGPWRGQDTADRRDKRLRNAAGIGVLLLCVASLVDPALHTPGMFSFGCLLAGLALRPASTSESAGRALILLRKGAGVFCLLAALAWVLMANGHALIGGNSIYRQRYAEAVALSAAGDDAAALQKWNEAAALKPLQWESYFERARVKLRLGFPSREALDDFGRARHLEPHNVLLCRFEYEMWERYDPVSGIPALREILRRDPPRGGQYYQGHVGKVREHAALRPHMLAIAKSDPKLMRLYLFSATDDEFAGLLHGLVDAHPALDIFTPEERLELFQVWHDRGDAAEVVRRLEENPVWQKEGWPVLAAHKAKAGDFRGAYEVALKNVPAPRPRASRAQGGLVDLARAFRLAPDPEAGFDLYEAQRREGNHDDALATLDQLAKLPHPPASVLYQRGVTLAAKEDYAAAWQALRDYSQRLPKGEEDS